MNTAFWFLTVENILSLQRKLIDDFGGEHGVRNMDVIESAVESVHQTFDSVDLYPTVFDKAATYAFQIAQGQGFLDGNKRTGAQAALVFLDINGYELLESAGDKLEVALNQVAVREMTRTGLSELFRDLYVEACAAR